MKALLGTMLLAAAAAGAQAQSVQATWQLSHDTDGLDQRHATLGYIGAAGWGVKAGAMHFSAPAGWSAGGQLLAATYRRPAAPGVPVPLRLLEASLGAAHIGHQTHAVASFEWLRPLGAASAIGVSAERNVLDSQQGIDDGLVFNSAALVGDHAFNARFNVGAAVGVTGFPDDNRRPFLRTRWNLALNESIGLNAYLKTRSYRNTNPYRAAYYSPERLNELSLGLSTRFAAGERVVLSAGADAGQQHTENGREAIWSVALGVAALRQAPLQWSLGLQAANTAAAFGGGGGYRYTALVGQLRVPF